MSTATAAQSEPLECEECQGRGGLCIRTGLSDWEDGVVCERCSGTGFAICMGHGCDAVATVIFDRWPWCQNCLREE